jgi:dolichyl-phosphooligosaccharide-protein glycotransferase
MDIPAVRMNQSRILVLVLLFFMAVAFILRIVPAIVTRDMAFFPVYDTDTWYNLRQIEVMVHHFPQYNWFDPMTAYPGGKVVDWGPAYPFLATVFCILTGAQTQSAIIAAAGYVSPLMAVLMVPVMYCLGTIISDRKTGIAAAGLITVTSFLYFTFSSYGMVDHHIAEVLFISLFCVTYLSAIHYAKEHPPDKNHPDTIIYFCFLSVLAGIFYFIGLLVSTTVLLILLVVAFFTFLQAITDFLKERDMDYLCILNLLLLGIATILLFLFGFKQEGLSFTRYSLGLVLVHGVLAAETIVLCALSKAFHGKRTSFLLALAGLILGGIIIIQMIPALTQISLQAMNLFFGYSAYSVGVQETLPWSFSGVYDAINVAIVLVAGGFLVLGYRLFKNLDRVLIFFLVWSVFMLLLTIRFQRFLYYFTVNIVLLSALCITEPFRWDHNRVLHRIPFIHSRLSGTGLKEFSGNNPAASEKPKKKRKTGPVTSNTAGLWDILKLACLIMVCSLCVTHVALSLSQDYDYAASAKDRTIPADWIESLEWLRTETPDPGIDYYAPYESRGYTAPPDSYGIFAVWDAGHWITFFSHRMPVANPFQDNLGGDAGTATFFLGNNETKADTILQKFRGRFVITDSSMAVDRFTNLVPWMEGSVDISSYIKWFLSPDPGNPSHLKKIHLFDKGYFQTMVVRLHNFDGSFITPVSAEYIQYTIRKPTALESADASGFSRVISSRDTVNLTKFNATTTPIIEEGAELLPTTYAALYSGRPDQPLTTIPALTHYRLVHESPENASVTPFPESEPYTLPGIKTVKVFEYVKGARINGNGIIELPVVTNTGRTFVYRQESSGGEFIVPYSTQGNPYEVRATGPYHIIGTSRSIEVTEEAVIKGEAVKV